MKINIFKNSSEYETYTKGQKIFDEGDAAEFMYALIEGEVSITVNDKEIDHLTPGDVFGEMALVDSSPRSGAAVAATDEVKVVPINQKRFEFLVQQTPFFAVQMLQIFSERMRRLMHKNS